MYCAFSEESSCFSICAYSVGPDRVIVESHSENSLWPSKRGAKTTRDKNLFVVMSSHIYGTC